MLMSRHLQTTAKSSSSAVSLSFFVFFVTLGRLFCFYNSHPTFSLGNHHGVVQSIWGFITTSGLVFYHSPATAELYCAAGVVSDSALLISSIFSTFGNKIYLSMGSQLRCNAYLSDVDISGVLYGVMLCADVHRFAEKASALRVSLNYS